MKFQLPILKDRVLIVQTEEMNHRLLGLLRKVLKPLGVVAVLGFAPETKVNAVSIDKAIDYLQGLKEKQNG